MKSSDRIRAIAFDAYGTLFDVYSVGALAEQLFPGKGEALAALWRLKQIEYSFLRTLSDRYKPFLEVTEDALVFSAKKLGLTLGESQRRQLMNQYACLSPFPSPLSFETTNPLTWRSIPWQCRWNSFILASRSSSVTKARGT